jgi:hypothetical protein
MKQKVAAATAFSEMTQWFLVTIAEGINCDIADPDDDDHRKAVMEAARYLGKYLELVEWLINNDVQEPFDAIIAQFANVPPTVQQH